MRAGRKGKAFLMSKYRTRTRRWSRLLSGVLCLALMLGLMPVTGVVQTAEAAHWADPYGEQLVEWGVIRSSPDLRMGDTITRAEFVAMCNRAFGFSRLGSTPFVDVPPSAWYAQDINIAYNAGYFKGTSGDTASPLGTLTREQAAVLVARCMVMQETVGEGLNFTDSRDLSDWSRGLVSTIADEGIISGLPGGSFAPANEITRGEVAAILVRAIGNPINAPGSYVMGDVYGNVTISSSNVTLRDTVILGNLYITGGVDLGNVLLENVTVLGQIVISGGGASDAAKSSVILRNVTADEMVIDSIIDQFVTVSCYGLTDIPNTYVRSSAYLEDSSNAGYGLLEIVQDGASLLQVAGSIKKVINKTPNSTLQLVQGTAEVITIDEYATNSELLIDMNTRVDVLNLDVATLVTGEGDIIQLNIGANGSEVEILPEHVDIRPGLTATVNGEEIGSVAAAELSSEPRLMAGYPAVDNLRPTQAEGLYSGNKPGTIYWAVSELADGSVSVEDLIKNPAYGGNIFKDGQQNQSGSIAAAAKVIYGRQITGLEPDGSYYISAILVDDRGNRSPLKVISFRTPDDTVPAFAEGPRMSLVSCETAQVTAMANKNCTMYWVLLPAGAVAPTVQNFKSGSFGGNLGHGSMSVSKNVPISVKVNAHRLQEDTYYDLYLWLNDLDGTLSSEIIHVTHESAAGTKYSFRTPDETAPVVLKVEQTGAGESTAEVTFSINEAPSTLYWAVVTEGNETFIPSDFDPNSSSVRIRVENGTKAKAIVSGSMAAEGANVETVINNITGLLYSTYGTHRFKFWYVAKDAAGNYSPVNYTIIQTLDNDPPHAWLTFSDAMNGSPRANSDIRITFDEQVKGGVSAAQTFLELYEDVKLYGGDEQVDAKNRLAKALSDHIKLYLIPRTGGAQLLNPVEDNDVGKKDNDSFSWVIDWHEAIVTLEKGNMVITLPGATRVENGVSMVQAINLDSGATYEFRLRGVFDDADPANGVAVDADGLCITEGRGVTNDDGNGILPVFTTLYAQVELSENSSVTKIDDGGDYDGIRLDLVVDVNPQSTSKVPDTEYWDMVIWNASGNNVPVQFEIYRQIIKKSDNEKTGWDLVLETKNYSLDIGSNTEAISWNERKEADVGAAYETVKDGLDQDYIYRYGIHFTSVNDIPETYGLPENEWDDARKNDPTVWGEKVTLKFSVVAGEMGVLSRQFKGDIKSVYDFLVGSTDLTEIGVVYLKSGQTTSILECSRQFVDTMPPVFLESFPNFDVGSGSVVINVALDRPGKVYYVVAPAGSIQTITGDGTTTITREKDGSEFDEYIDDKDDTERQNMVKAFFEEIQKGGATGDALKTYIPRNGTERDGFYKNYIYFMTGGTSSGRGKYYAPTYSAVIRGAYVNAQKGTITYDSEVATATVTNLEPLKEYYVYMVLEGNGDADQIVQIYRVTTTKVQPPAVEIRMANGTTADGKTSVNNTAVDMTVYDTDDAGKQNGKCVNPELYYTLWERTSLPRIFNELFKDHLDETKTTGINISGTMTVLDALQETVPGESIQTYFDVCADDTTKENVLQYITGRRTDSTAYPASYRGSATVNEKYENCYPYMTAEGAEYIMVACARNTSGGTTGASYGFSALPSLFVPDMVPPELIWDSENNYPIALTGADTSGTFTEFDGTLYLSFTKKLYYQPESNASHNRYEVMDSTSDINEEKKTVGLKSILGGSAVTNGRVTIRGSSKAVGTSISLTIRKIQEGETIELFLNGVMCNSSNYASQYRVELTFKSQLYATDYGETSESYLNVRRPGFIVKLIKIR